MGKVTDQKGPLPYKVICISLYHEDLRELDDFIVSLNALGYRQANRSALIRIALRDLKRRGATNINQKDLYRGRRGRET